MVGLHATLSLQRNRWPRSACQWVMTPKIKPAVLRLCGPHEIAEACRYKNNRREQDTAQVGDNPACVVREQHAEHSCCPMSGCRHDTRLLNPCRTLIASTRALNASASSCECRDAGRPSMPGSMKCIACRPPLQ